MITILRFILFFLVTPALAIVAQAAGTFQDDFRIVDTGFWTESVIVDCVGDEICHYDSSGALLHQRKSIDGEDDISRYQGLKTLGATGPLFSFLAEFVAANRIDDVPIKWPENRGFVAGEGGRASVLPGQTLDRFGGNNGSFLSPAGTPASARSLAPGTDLKPLNSFEVLKPFEVDAGRAAPWFNQPGGGLQFDLGTRTVQDLIDAQILRPLQ